MPLSLAFSTPLKSRSLPQISLIFMDYYGFDLLLAFGRNLINLIALSSAPYKVLRNKLPPFLPLVPSSVIESYKCDGTHFRDQSESVQFRFSARVSLRRYEERW